MNSPNQKIKLAVIDSQPLFRERLKWVLERDKNIKVIAEGETAEELLPLYKQYNPDVVLLDTNLPHRKAIKAMEDLLNQAPNAKVLAFTVADDSLSVLQVLKGEASGYLLKEVNPSGIIAAIKTVMSDGFYLHPKVTKYFLLSFKKLALNHTDGGFLQSSVRYPLHLLSERECEILHLLEDGHSNRTLSKTLGISENTVKNHVSTVLRKMNLHDRTQAVVTAIKNRWVVLN